MAETLSPEDRDLIVEVIGTDPRWYDGPISMELLGALVRASRSKGWQPIETAPRDRAVLLIARYPYSGGGYSDIRQGWWDKFLDDGEGGWARWPHFFNPTHWRELPAPPVSVGEVRDEP